MFLQLVVVICVLLSSFSEAHVKQVDTKFVSSLKDLLDIRGTALNDDQFVSLHSRALSQIQDTHHQDYGKKHTFALKMASTCTGHCYDKFAKSFGSQNVIRINDDVSIAYATESQLTEYMKVTTDDRVLVSYVPLVADSKVSNSAASGCVEFNKQDENALEQFMNEQSKSLEKRAVGGTRPLSKTSILMMNLAPMSSTEKSSFVSNLDLIVDRHSGDVQYSYKGSVEAVRPNKMGYLSLVVKGKDPDCSKTNALINELAELREVMRVERDYEVQTYNRWGKPISETGNEKAQTITVQGKLTGLDQIIGISDTGLDMSSCYFSDANVPTPYCSSTMPQPEGCINLNHRKVVQYVTFVDKSDDGTGHGSHVAGTVAGQSTFNYGDFIKYNGMSANAKLSFFDIGNTATESLQLPNDINKELFAVQYASGARIFSNSWGTPKQNQYSSRCANVDVFMYENQDALVLYAGGNDGDIGKKGERTIGSPGGAKSVLTVGATLSANEVFKAFPTSVPDGVTDIFSQTKLAYFSSQGPMKDGRIKPEILAPGWWTTSAMGTTGFTDASTPHCTLSTLQGTSMSTPTVAGMAGMVREYLMKGYYPYGTKTASQEFVPLGSLLKAMLVHSGKKIDGIVKVDPSSGATSSVALTDYPSSIQGWGRMQLDTLLNFGQPASCAPTCPVSKPNNPLTMFLVGNYESTGSSLNVVPSAKFIQADETQSFFFTTGAAQRSVRVTMAYSDFSDALSSSNCAEPGCNVKNHLTLSVQICSGAGSVTTGVGAGAGTCNGGGSVYRPRGLEGVTVGTVIKSPIQVIDIFPLPNTVYMISVKCTNLVSPMNQPYSLVATQDIISFTATAADDPYATYKKQSSDKVTDNISEGAAIIIAVFSVLSLILIVLVVIIYYAHKKADEIEKEEVNQAINNLARKHREAQLAAAGAQQQ